jgi:hypothetical protein
MAAAVPAVPLVLPLAPGLAAPAGLLEAVLTLQSRNLTIPAVVKQQQLVVDLDQKVEDYLQEHIDHLHLPLGRRHHRQHHHSALQSHLPFQEAFLALHLV